jgi:hypothetical protein
MATRARRTRLTVAQVTARYRSLMAVTPTERELIRLLRRQRRGDRRFVLDFLHRWSDPAPDDPDRA